MTQPQKADFTFSLLLEAIGQRPGMYLGFAPLTLGSLQAFLSGFSVGLRFEQNHHRMDLDLGILEYFLFNWPHS